MYLFAVSECAMGGGTGGKRHRELGLGGEAGWKLPLFLAHIGMAVAIAAP